MGRYDPLREFLKGRGAEEVPMTFDEIERIIGAPLPDSAENHRAWWSNNPSNNVMTKAWLAAGYQSERVDLGSRRLVFRRVTGTPPASGAPASTGGCHPVVGSLRGLLRVAPGTDLTTPAEPDWGAAT